MIIIIIQIKVKPKFSSVPEKTTCNNSFAAPFIDEIFVKYLL